MTYNDHLLATAVTLYIFSLCSFYRLLHILLSLLGAELRPIVLLFHSLAQTRHHSCNRKTLNLLLSPVTASSYCSLLQIIRLIFCSISVNPVQAMAGAPADQATAQHPGKLSKPPKPSRNNPYCGKNYRRTYTSLWARADFIP